MDNQPDKRFSREHKTDYPRCSNCGRRVMWDLDGGPYVDLCFCAAPIASKVFF